MFEILGADIAALNDEDLRTLIGRLCEAELRRRELSTAAVTWGGNQTAKDGGLDVRVTLPAEAPIDGFIPKPDSGFQVKKPDMPRRAIIDEMRPNGELRPVIIDLAEKSGAYIIVSSTGSTADSALQSRREAMREAVEDCPNSSKLTLDFYDRNRVATWVRDHAGMIPWVRARIGKSIPGWRSYGTWSYRPEGADPTYLLDDTARIKTGDKNEGDGISATDGINKMRDALRTPGQVVRLVGLSGVGKTRLVEALFEPTVGADALDQSLAVYTDISDNPDPQPNLLATDLIATGTRAILIIDNCPPAAHRQLAETVRQAGTMISVITIEYDIREDQPEGTDVFSLDTSSPELIEKLIEKRFSNLSQVDRKTIAESSGGNARVALALAGTVGKNETVKGLGDAELFKRLFQQRSDPDPALLSIAEACSLVYSFHGELLDGAEAELPVLGGLIGKSADDVFAAVAELKQRHLLQTRGPWRAVLPHAIANRLAATALEKIPRQRLIAALESAPTRLLKSFSRRLGYLDSSKEAQDIVQGWLSPSGLLSDVTKLNDLGRAMLGNVAPVMPDAVLSALENALSNADEATLENCGHFVRLLRSLAYAPKHFPRAVALLVKFARHSGAENLHSEAAEIFKSLFYIVLSGTHAPPATRLKVVEGLLLSADASEQTLGIDALQTMLKTSQFISKYNFEFGVRSRDYGYHPPTSEDVGNWYSATLDFAEPFAVLDNEVGQGLRDAIAHEFRGLWTSVSRVSKLERLSIAVSAKGFWREGWIAARQTARYDGTTLPPEILARLKVLEESLRPKDLVDQVRGLVLRAKGSGQGIDLDDLDDVNGDDYAATLARMEERIERLGNDVAVDDEAIKMLLPELLVGGHEIFIFGRGMGSAAENPREMWQLMRTQAKTTNQQRVQLLAGFLSGVQTRDRTLVDALLEEAVEDGTLAPSFPILQALVGIDDNGLTRLYRALALDKAPIDTYLGLAYGRACDAIPGPEFKRLVLTINAKPNGTPVALKILSMRIHSDGIDKKPSVPEVAEAGRALLSDFEFRRKDNAQHEDYELGVLIRASLIGDDGRPIARKLCRKFLEASSDYKISGFEYNDLMTALFETHSADVLDEMVSGDKKAQSRSIALISEIESLYQNPMQGIPEDMIIAWCDQDAEARYPFAAAIAPLFGQSNDQAPASWLPLTRRLLMRAPDQKAVFNEIVSREHPTGGVGSISSQYELRLKALDQLDLCDMPMLARSLEKAREELLESMEKWRSRETEEDRARSGTFE